MAGINNQDCPGVDPDETAISPADLAGIRAWEEASSHKSWNSSSVKRVRESEMRSLPRGRRPTKGNQQDLPAINIDVFQVSWQARFSDWPSVRDQCASCRGLRPICTSSPRSNPIWSGRPPQELAGLHRGFSSRRNPGGKANGSCRGAMVWRLRQIHT